MANSFVQYTANGATTQFALTFGYIEKSHISVKIDGVADNAFTWVNASAIQTSSTPVNGAVVEVRRTTPETPIVNFTDASTLTATNLNTSVLQVIYVAQEAEDSVVNVLGQNAGGNWNANNRRIVSLAAPVDSADAATKAYVLSVVGDAPSHATAAAASAATAATSATSASTSATSAASSATTASGHATTASTHATNAGTSATSAAASASTAAAAATTAVNTALQQDFTQQTSSFTATNRGKHAPDITSANVDITLPTGTAVEGDWFEVWDSKNTFGSATYKCRVIANETQFDALGAAASFTHVHLDTAKVLYRFIYESGKWRIA